MITDILTTVSSKSIAALETGIDESKIVSVAFELDYLRKHGLLIDIAVSGVGMFTRSAQLGELGINSSDEKSKRYSPGSKYLIPKETVDRLRSVETRMRQAHLKYCTDVAGFRPYRWLPYTAYKSFKRRWTELHEEFEKIKLAIIYNLDAYRELLTDEFAAGARHTWAAIEGQGYSAIIFSGTGYVSRDAFVDSVVALALAQFPSADKVESDLRADYTVGVIFTDFDAKAYAIEADMAYAKAESQKEIASLQTAMLQEQYDNERRLNQLAQQQREFEIEAMMAAEMAHAKEQLEQIRHPFEEVFICLRQDIAEACDEIKASIDKNGLVRGKVAERAAGLVEFYDLLAAHDDKELRAKLVELRAKIGTIGDDRPKDAPARSADEIKKTLTEIVEMANLEASELANLSRAAFLEI
jgi:hypothetical protein